MKTELQRGGVTAADFRFAIVVSRWNSEFTSRLEKGAREALTQAGANADAVVTFHVPGAFELPLACQQAASDGDFDAVIALGVVIRGDTPHFDFVAGEAARGIMKVALETGVPIMFGVITADNVEQTEARCGVGVDNKGYEAALSGVEMAQLMRDMKARREESRGPF